MGELNEPASNFRLLQVDFYNILSPMTFIDDSKTSFAQTFEELTPLIEGSREYHDYFLMQQLHGFSSESNPTTFRNLAMSIEGLNETIPLRSIRVRLKEGMNVAWAPNGYGKTYIFDLLDRLKSVNRKAIQERWELNSLRRRRSRKDKEVHELVQHYKMYESNWKVEFNNLNHGKAKGNQILPYHALGLIFDAKEESDTTEEVGLQRFALLIMRPHDTDSIAYIRKIPNIMQEDNHEDALQKNTDKDYPGSKTVGPMWAYTKNQSWIELSKDFDLDRVSPFDFEINLKNTVTIKRHISKAISAFNELEVTYVETPSLSDKAGFSKDDYVNNCITNLTQNQASFLSIVNPELTEDPISPDDLFAMYNDNSLPEPSFLDCLQRIHDELLFYTDSMGIALESYEPIQSQHKINQWMEQIYDNGNFNSSDRGSFDPPFWPSSIEEVISIAECLRDILFTTSNVNNSFRFEIFDKLYKWLEFGRSDVTYLIKMIYELIVVYKIEYLYTKLDEDPLSSSNDEFYILLNQILQDDLRSYSKFRALIIAQEIFSKKPFPQLSDNSSLDLIEYLRRRLPFSERNEESILYSIFENEHETSLYEKAIQVAKAVLSYPVDDHLAPAVEQTSYFPWFLSNSGFFDNKEYESRYQYFVEEFLEVRDYEKYLDQEDAIDLLRPNFKVLGVNPYLVDQNLNQCINPDDFNDPWAVQARIEWGHGQNKSAITFHPKNDKYDNILPEHLSFGMRSEIILQLALTNLLYDMRSKKGEGFKLLVLDESEVGRSEYWTEKLIQRFQRLEKQMGQSSGFQTLIVSHRGLLLERSSSSSYFIMHRVPETLDDEDDDDEF